MRASRGLPNIYNNIIWGNSSDLNLKNDSGGINLYYNDFDPTKASLWSPVNQGNNLNADPLFVDPANADFHLSENSPLINQGYNSAPSLPADDFEGNQRIAQGVVDIGADEYALIPSFTVTPTLGITPFTAYFIDTSKSVDGEVVSWAWDLNGDGIIDSNLQNPSFTYTTIGKYKVTLTVTDSKGNKGSISSYVTADNDNDGDGIANSIDNCPDAYNPTQLDLNGNGIGDACKNHADLLARAEYRTGLSKPDAWFVSGYGTDVTAIMKDGLFSQSIYVQNSKGKYDVVSFLSPAEASKLSTVVLHVYVSGLYKGVAQNATVYAYNTDGNTVQTSKTQAFMLFSGWNNLDLTSLAHLMDGYGFTKFRIAVPNNWVAISEAYFTMLADTWEVGINPAQLNFGAVEIGKSGTQNFTVSNAGTGNLIIKGIKAPPQPFTISTDNCSGKTLAASAACSVSVTFAPISAGTFTTVLNVLSNDSDNPSAAVNLSGTGVLPSNALTGTVTDASTAKSLSTVSVTVSDFNGTHTGVTDVNGTYTILGVADGSFTAVFEKTGYATKTTTGTKTAGQVYTLNVSLSPMPPLTLSITSPQNGAILNTSTIVVTGTVSNSASVSVNGTQATVSNGTFTASLLMPDGQKTITATAIDQYGQTASLSVTFTVLTKGTVTGKVIDSSTGLPVPAAQVIIIDSLLTTLTALADSDGNYTVPNVAQGSYSISITLPDYSTYTFSGNLIAGQTVTVNSSIRLQSPTISGVSVPSLAIDSATVTWATDQAASSLLEYGTTTSYGSATNDSAMTTSHIVNLTGLIQGVTYHYRITSTNSHNLSSSTIDNTFTTPSPPIITSVTITAITKDSATITWTTDQPSDSLVSYGATTAYGTSTANTTSTQNHSVTLAGLTEQMLYHFMVTTRNSAGLSSSSTDMTFWTKSSAFTATTFGDFGNVTVMEVSGNYDVNNPDGTINSLPRQEIAKEFYRTHPDDYDTLVIMTNFDFAMPAAETKAFYTEIRNDTQGIGRPLTDGSGLYGSSGRLYGTIDMGNISVLGVNPPDPDKFDSTLDVLAHEQMHRWGVYVRFKNPDNTLNSALLGKDGRHWSYLVDSDGSVMYGNDWKANGDGTFTSVSAPKYYSNLDLYLMGMIDKSQVAPMMLIENPGIDPTLLPTLGTTITGTVRTVMIDDIIAAEGERIPNASTSQKSFKTGFIFITRPGTFTGNEPTGIETIRNAWAGRFASLTGGKGSIEGVAPSLSVTITSPSDGTTINRPDITVRGVIANSTGNETGVTVNGVVAMVSGSQFIAEHVPLAEGSNTITVTATDTTGSSSTSSITVNAAAVGTYIRVTSNIESGIAPLEATLRVDGTFSIAGTSINATGPAAPEITTIAPDEYKVKMNAEGTYTFTVTSTGPDQNTYQDTATITVMNKNQIDSLLKAKWEGMKTALLAGDIEHALEYFVEPSKDMFMQALMALESEGINSRFSNITVLHFGTMFGTFAQYWALRSEDRGMFAYPVTFILDSNGVWKIMGF